MAELGPQTPAPTFPGSRWEKGSSSEPLTFTEGKVWGLIVPQGVCARREAVSLKDVGVFIRRLGAADSRVHILTPRAHEGDLTGERIFADAVRIL